MDSPLVSIIVPVYNCENNLPYCLNSISRQSYKNIEVILVDDGSKDASFGVCKKYSQKDSRFRAITMQNSGVSHARNAGLREAKGSFVCFIDADDEISPEFVSKLLAPLLDSDAAFSACSIVRLREYGGLPDASKASNARVMDRESALHSFLCRIDPQLCASACSKMIRMNIIGGLLFDESKAVNEDKLFVLDLLMASNQICIINDKLYGYYSRPGSASKRSLLNGLKDPETVAELILVRVLKEAPSLVDDASYNLYRTQLMVFHNIVRDASCKRREVRDYGYELKRKLLVSDVKLPLSLRLERVMMLLPLSMYRLFLKGFDAATSHRTASHHAKKIS